MGESAKSGSVKIIALLAIGIAVVAIVAALLRKGAPGANGAVGATGADGTSGPKGPSGLVGPTGANGPQGAQGDRGTAGTSLVVDGNPFFCTNAVVHEFSKANPSGKYSNDSTSNPYDITFNPDQSGTLYIFSGTVTDNKDFYIRLTQGAGLLPGMTLAINNTPSVRPNGDSSDSKTLWLSPIGFSNFDCGSKDVKKDDAWAIAPGQTAIYRIVPSDFGNGNALSHFGATKNA